MHSSPTVLVFPAWDDNPFLNMLNLAPRAEGYRFRAATNYAGFLAESETLVRGDTLHVHWTSPLIQAAPTPEDARERLAAILDRLRSLREGGVHLVWTVHNRLPHELHHRDEELALYRELANGADAVHVMSPATAELLADVCELPPERVHVIPHPSYRGLYERGLDRATARATFGLAETDVATLFLGHIRPYKGVGALIEGAAAARRADGRDVVLLLAGGVSEQDASAVTDAVPPTLRSVTHIGFVPDDDVSRWFLAADVAVFPYRAILNSGSVHLAATFGVPVILPGEPHLRVQFADEKWVAFFDTDRPAESIAELLGDPALFAAVTPEDFTRFTAAISPWSVSLRYAELLDAVSTTSSAL